MRKPERVGDDMALVALDPFTCVITASPAAFSCFYGLAVDHTCGRGRLSAMQSPRYRHQKMADYLKDAIVSPAVEIVAHGGHRREIIGQHAPRTTGAGDIQNRIQNITHFGLTRAARCLGWWNEWCN